MSAVIKRRRTGGQSALRKRVEELLQMEISFIYSREFDGQRSLADDSDLVDALLSTRHECTSRPRDPGREIFSGLTSLRVPLLKPTEEQALFRHLNFELFQANSLRSRLNPSRPSHRAIREIEQRLDRAEAIRTRIVESNSRLVLSVARKKSSSQQQFEDFVSEGFVILLGAIAKFDYSRGFRFSTYATHSLQRHYYRVWQKSQKRNQRFVATPTTVLSDVIKSTDEELSEIDTTATGKDIWERAQRELDDRERTILLRRFGLHGDKAETLREVAAHLGISKERVRQLQIRALEKLEEMTTELGLKNAIVDALPA